MKTPTEGERPSHWGISSGLYGGAAAWYADQQLVISRAYASCSTDIRAYAISVALICLSVAVVSSLISMQAVAALSTSTSQARTRRFIGILSIGMGIIAILGISFATLATLFLACER